jgi:hypothetical protein
MSNTFDNIIFNIVGGAIVVLLDRVIIWACKKYTGYRFKRIFGSKVDDYHIVYGELFRKDESSHFPYEKPGSGYNFRTSSVIPYSDSRAASCIAFAFHKHTKKSPTLISDEKCKNTTSLSYCSVGGRNNFKSNYIIESKKNHFIQFNIDSITSKADPSVNYGNQPDYNFDYCTIIKIYDGDNTKICISGIGEWGTTGGAWYLANKWRDLHKIVGNTEFGAIIRVRINSDDSAELVYVVYGYELKTYKCN